MTLEYLASQLYIIIHISWLLMLPNYLPLRLSAWLFMCGQAAVRLCLLCVRFLRGNFSL